MLVRRVGISILLLLCVVCGKCTDNSTTTNVTFTAHNSSQQVSERDWRWWRNNENHNNKTPTIVAVIATPEMMMMQDDSRSANHEQDVDAEMARNLTTSSTLRQQITERICPPLQVESRTVGDTEVPKGPDFGDRHRFNVIYRYLDERIANLTVLYNRERTEKSSLSSQVVQLRQSNDELIVYMDMLEKEIIYLNKKLHNGGVTQNNKFEPNFNDNKFTITNNDNVHDATHNYNININPENPNLNFKNNFNVNNNNKPFPVHVNSKPTSPPPPPPPPSFLFNPSNNNKNPFIFNTHSKNNINSKINASNNSPQIHQSNSNYYGMSLYCSDYKNQYKVCSNNDTILEGIMTLLD